jgi:hypothetical protein
MVLSYKVDAKDDKGSAGTVTFKDLQIEGESPPEAPSAQLSLGKRGESLSSSSEFGDDFRRMMIPFFPAFPDAEVKPGDAWTFEYAPSGASKVTYSAKATGVEQIEGKEVLKVTVKAEEVGESGLKSDGTYWLRQDGKVAKLEVSPRIGRFPWRMGK